MQKTNKKQDISRSLPPPAQPTQQTQKLKVSSKTPLKASSKVRIIAKPPSSTPSTSLTSSISSSSPIPVKSQTHVKISTKGDYTEVKSGKNVVLRPCVGLHDCKKALKEKTKANKAPETYKVCYGDEADLDCGSYGFVGLPIHVVNSIFEAPEFDWSLEHTGAYSQCKNRVQWTTNITNKPTCGCDAIFTVNGAMGIKNTGTGASDLGNVVVNLQVPDRCGDGFKTIYSAVRSLLPTNGNQQGNIVPGSSSESSTSYFVNSPNANLTVTDINKDDMFSTTDSLLRTVDSCKFKYYAFAADFTLPRSFCKTTRVEVILTFGNAGNGCEGNSGNQIAYQGGSTLYDNVTSVTYVTFPDTVPLVLIHKQTVLQTSLASTVVVSGGGSIRNFTTDIGMTSGFVGSEFVGSLIDKSKTKSSHCPPHSTVRNTAITPCPQVSHNDRIFQNIVNLSVQTDPVVFNLPLEPGSNKTVTFTFINPDSGLYHLKAANVLVSAGCNTPMFRSGQGFTNYTRTDLAQDYQGSFTSVWDTFGPGGLVLTSPLGGGRTITFTDPEAVRANLNLATDTAGTIKYDMLNPYSTQAGSFLSSVLWFIFTLAANPEYEDMTINSDELFLKLTPNKINSGVQQDIASYDGKTSRALLESMLILLLSDTPSDSSSLNTKSKSKNIKNINGLKNVNRASIVITSGFISAFGGNTSLEIYMRDLLNRNIGL